MLVILYLGIGSSELEARVLYLATAAFYTIAMGLCLAGVIPAVGLVDAAVPSRWRGRAQIHRR